MNITMSIAKFLGWMLGLENTQSVDRVSFSLGAPWAHDAPAWLLFGSLALVAAALFVYFRAAPSTKHRVIRIGLATGRALALCLLLFALAEPILNVLVTTRPRPSLWVLFDGTDSMNIADELPADDRTKLAEATGLKLPEPGPGGVVPATPRIDYVKSLVLKEQNNLLGRLEEKFRIRPFLFERATGVRQLETAPDGRTTIDRKHLVDQLTTQGQTTALGSAISELGRRHVTSSLGGLVVISDFNQNAGPSAVEAAKQLGVKVYTIGVGPAAAVDVSVALQAPLVTKKDERATLTVLVRQQGLNNVPVTVKVTSRPIGPGIAADVQPTAVGEKSIRLGESVQSLEFPYTPDKIGQYEVAAEIDPVEGEVVRDNNRAVREISVRDDFIRLFFAEYEPTWEWRFIKEVFHRDKLVGMRGFRTFLRSSDPRVRQTNALFTPSIAPPRAEFFANDVIMLGDMAGSALSSRFCEMVEEFVGNFGGGLVVMAGPRFGPGQLADTLLGKMLPVVVDPAAKIRDHEPFRLHLRPEAGQVDFMQLGSDAAEFNKAWDNLGEIPWYQPVERAHPMATVLAEHPTDTCADGKSHQPLIAIRRYGRGEVVYLGFNEMWRLRKKYGELYYRQFWGQMIHRLALSHALGTQKRFVVHTDRRRYQGDDQVLLTVEAYDADFQPLAESAVPGGSLKAEMFLPAQAAREEGKNLQSLTIPALRKGVFEVRVPVFAGGEYRVRVVDPVTEEASEVSFQVISVSAERQQAVRDVALEQALADNTGGKYYDLVSAKKLPDEIRLTPRGESREMRIALWNTWFFFGIIVLLLLGEWLVRKWINLP
jgi:hypothetical protein